MVKRGRFRRSFFCNIHLIEDSYRKKKIAILTNNSEVVGFATWYDDTIKRIIDIVEIHPEYRQNKLCKLLLEHLENEFLKEGIIVCELQCSPASSEIIWKKLGFSEYPTVPDGWRSQRGKKQLFKTLVKTFQPSDSPDFGNKLIELWNNSL